VSDAWTTGNLPSSEGKAEAKIRALPAQLIERNGEAILKRGCVELRIGGEGGVEALRVVLTAAGDAEMTASEIAGVFPALDRPAVRDLIDELLRKRSLERVDDDDRSAIGDASADLETSLDIFYWHFGERRDQVAERLDSKRIVVVGVNQISVRLVSSFASIGVTEVETVDYPLLRNVRLFSDGEHVTPAVWPDATKPPIPYEEWTAGHPENGLDCLVATSDFGGLQLMRDWNTFCVRNRCVFFPVVLQDLVGYVGPIVVPGQTACFECLRARQNAAMADPAAERASEYAAFEGQLVTGFHPSLASILGDVAAVELLKFYGIRLPISSVGSLIEVNLLATSIATRRVLKIPRCPVCSPLNARSSVQLVKTSYLDYDHVLE